MGKFKSKKNSIKAGANLTDTIALDPNLVASDFEGLIAFEEITDYKISKSNEIVYGSKLSPNKKLKKDKVKRLKNEVGKKSLNNNRKVIKENGSNAETKTKKNSTSETSSKGKKKKKKRNPSANIVKTNLKNQSMTHNEDSEDTDDNIPQLVAANEPSEGMDAWSGMGISEPLLAALKLKGFTIPTQVQALSLPPAILGRRDILGAAETGSGKTLAFGLPILQGILIQKELAEKHVSEKVKENMIDDKESDDGSEEILNQNSSDDENNAEVEENAENEEQDSAEDVDDDEEKETAEGEDDAEDKIDELEDEDYELVEDDFDEEYSDDADGSDDNAEDLGCVNVVDNAVFNLNDPLSRKYRQKPLYALILTPTRELAVQIKKHILDAAALTDIKVALVVGGLSSQKQERLLSYGPEIVVGTPGRLWELIQQRHPHLSHIENIRFLAIDETDRMLEKGHFEELSQLLTLLNDNKPEGIRRQNFLFSATLTMVHAPPSYIKRLKKKRQNPQLTPQAKLQNIVKQMGLQNPKVVDITQPNCVPKTLKEARIICTTEDKDFYLYYFLKLHPGRTLVFCNSIGCVQRLHSLFTLLQCNPHPLHSNLQQRQRLKNLERFTQNPKSILVATDVAARGLDVPNVQHVIHYQVPRTAESYVHRSGRTARASEDGLTVLLMDGSEVRTYTKIFNTLSRDPILPDFPIESKYLTKVKDRVKLARQLDSLELQAKRHSSEESWVKKAVTEMDLELSDDEMPIRSSRGEVEQVKKKAADVRKRLSVLIKQPLFDPVEQLSKKAFITSGINSDGSYSAVKGPKPSAVEALQDAVEERKETRRKRRLARAESKQASKISSDAASKKVQQSESDVTSEQGDEVGGIVEYPDFSKSSGPKTKKRKND